MGLRPGHENLRVGKREWLQEYYVKNEALFGKKSTISKKMSNSSDVLRVSKEGAAIVVHVIVDGKFCRCSLTFEASMIR